MTPFPPPTYSGNLKHILTGGLLAETVLPRVMPIQRQTCKLLNGDRAWGSCGTPLHLRRRPGMLLFAGCCAGGRGRMAHCNQNTFGNQTLREKAPDTLKGWVSQCCRAGTPSISAPFFCLLCLKHSVQTWKWDVGSLKVLLGPCLHLC